MPRLAAAVSAAAVLVLGAPYVGQIRGAIRSAFPNQFRLIIGGIIALLAGAAVIAAVRTIRDRRAFRYGAIAAAIVCAASYIAAFRTGNPDVDVVEAFHVVEYGLITYLFYRVWRDRDDFSALLVPVLAAMVVGVFDEWMQWFVPVRVGEIRDVWLNAAAIGCGLLFSIGLEPPPALRLSIGLRSRVLVGTACALTLLVTGVFVAIIHLGHEVEVEEGGVFLSRYSADELRAASADRASRWQSDPPQELRRFSREDQYLTEGTWHLQRRNEAWETDIETAFYENAILERFFAPVIDTPSYLVPAISRWPEGQRRDAAQRTAHRDAGPGRFVSQANPFPIVTWPRPLFLVGVAFASAAVAILCLYNAPRRRLEAS